jgi:hypothetical protein
MLPGYSVAVLIVAKFAVIVPPVPVIVAVVDAADGLANVTGPVALQDENA